MKKLFLFSWLMMLSIVAVAQNEKVGNDLVIKNGSGTVVERVSATESTELKIDAKGNKLSVKQDGQTKDISLDEVKTITAVPSFKLVAQDKFVYTSTSPITLHFKLTVNDQGEMKPASGESVTFTANKGTLVLTGGLSPCEVFLSFSWWFGLFFVLLWRLMFKEYDKACKRS